MVAADQNGLLILNAASVEKWWCILRFTCLILQCVAFMFEMLADRFAALQCLRSDRIELAAVMKLENFVMKLGCGA
jgi:hypothetical protein